jgi:hypothetical protein
MRIDEIDRAIVSDFDRKSNSVPVGSSLNYYRELTEIPTMPGPESPINLQNSDLSTTNGRQTGAANDAVT